MKDSNLTDELITIKETLVKIENALGIPNEPEEMGLSKISEEFSVTSSSIAWVKYTFPTETLEVMYTSSEEKYPFPMPEDDYKQFKKTSSKGGFMNLYKKMLKLSGVK